MNKKQLFQKMWVFWETRYPQPTKDDPKMKRRVIAWNDGLLRPVYFTASSLNADYNNRAFREGLIYEFLKEGITMELSGFRCDFWMELYGPIIKGDENG